MHKALYLHLLLFVILSSGASLVLRETHGLLFLIWLKTMLLLRLGSIFLVIYMVHHFGIDAEILSAIVSLD